MSGRYHSPQPPRRARTLIRNASDTTMTSSQHLDDGGDSTHKLDPPGLMASETSRQSLTDALEGHITSRSGQSSRPPSSRAVTARNKVEFMLASTEVIPPRAGVFPPADFGRAQSDGLPLTVPIRDSIIPELDEDAASIASSEHSATSGTSFGSGTSAGSGKINSRAARAMGNRRLSRLVLRIPVLWRAVIIISVPIIALLILAGLSVSDSHEKLQQAVDDDKMMEFVHVLGDALHELQVERARTSVWITCVNLHAKDFPTCVENRASLEEERHLFDQKRDKFVDVTYTFNHPLTDYEGFKKTLRRLQGIDQHRSLVDSDSLTYTSAVHWYDLAVTGLYDTERSSYQYIKDTDILRIFIPYLELQEASEVAGQLRWTGSKLAVTGKFDSILDQEHFYFLIEEYDHILELLEHSAPQSVLDVWLPKKADDSLYRSYITTFLSYSVTSTQPFNEQLSLDWFAALSDQIAAIDDTLTELFSEIEGISRDHRARESTSLAVTIVLVCVFLILCSFLTLVLARSVNATTKVLKDEVKKRRKMTSAIQRFFPSEFMSMLGKGAVTDIEDGMSTQVNVTVMFMDIRNFTSICEGFDLEQSFNLLHSYAKFVSPIITSNRGFIDKMMGDGIMAVFETAPDAIRAAVKVQYELSCINNETSSLLQSKHQSARPFLKVGIGIHTGDVILGTLGDKRRIDGTIVGDAVNIAARLEGLTKFFGVNILVSREVLDASEVAEDMEGLSYRQLGQVRVKGKTKSLAIYDIYHADDITMKTFKESTRAQFEDACQMYSRGQFGKAQELLNTLEQSFPILRDQSVERRMFLAEEKMSMYANIENEDNGTNPWDGVDNFNPA